MNSPRRRAIERGAGKAPLRAASASPGGAAPDASPCGDDRVTVQVALDFVDLPRAIAVAARGRGRRLRLGGGRHAAASRARAWTRCASSGPLPRQDHRRRHEDHGRRPRRGRVRRQGRRWRRRRPGRGLATPPSRSASRPAATTAAKLIVDLIEVADPVAARQGRRGAGRRLHRHPRGHRRADARRDPFDILRAVRRGRVHPGERRRRHQLRDGGRGRRGGRRHRRGGRRHHQGDRRRRGGGRDPARRGRARLQSRPRSTSAPARPSVRARAATGLDGQRLRRPAPQPTPARHPRLCCPARTCAARRVTVRTYPGDWAKPVEAIDVCRPGDVLVIDAGGAVPPSGASWPPTRPR